MSNKRYDIQGLRAWAVVAVVIFHFFRSFLPWGYLGVDVFFVLSGFLISLVLENKPRALATYSDFYLKRFKRIFPLAVLIAFLNLIVISQNVELKLVKFGTRSALHAILFGTNFNVRDEGEDYFAALDQANDYFTHYWSLSVEIQFYVLAPLLLHVLKPSQAHPTLMLIYLSIVALCSLALFLLLPPTEAFSNTLCRLWQFISGSIAFNLGRMTSEHQPLPQTENDDKETTVTPRNRLLILIPMAAISIGAAVTLALEDFESFNRLCVTAAAASLLYLQSESVLLCHVSLQLLGDASYALYLLHWPVVCLLKDWEVDDYYYLLFSMIACVALSIAVHLTYEKWYLTLSTSYTFCLVGLLYLLCFSIIYFNSTRKPSPIDNKHFNATAMLLKWEPGSNYNFTETQVHNMNKVLASQLEASLTIPDCTPRKDVEKNDRFKFCYFPKGRGKLNFLVIGNSYALSPGKLVLEHFKKHYGNISIRAVPHCEPLIETKHKMCANVELAHKKFIEDAEREKPDVLFISSRYENPGIPILGNVSSDPLYLYMLEKLRSYEKLASQKVFILNSFPQLNSPAEVEKKRKAKKLPIEGFMPEAIYSDDVPMRLRTNELAKNCEKCVLYDIRSPHLNEKGQYMTADPVSHLWYFEGSIHYTSVGLKVIKPVFTQLSKDFDRLLKAKYPDNIFVLKH